MAGKAVVGQGGIANQNQHFKKESVIDAMIDSFTLKLEPLVTA